MALVSCPECSKDCSDKALTCPHCGYPIVISHQVAHSELLAKRIEEALSDQQIAVNVETDDQILYIKLTPDKSSENLNYYLLWMQISNLLTPDILKGFSRLLVSSTFEHDIKPSWQKFAEIDSHGKLTVTKVDDKNKSKVNQIKINPVYKAFAGVLVGVSLIGGSVGLFNYFSNIRSIPNLVGKSTDEAKITLKKQELKYEIVETELGNLPPDQVISQNPLVNTSSTKGSLVKLVVSKLPRLPKFFNIPVEDAQKILSDMKLSYEVTEKSTEAFEPRRVISQKPEADTPIKEGDKVQLVISKAPPPPPPSVYTIRGTLTLIDSAIDYSTTKPLGSMSQKEIMALPCYGSGGYKDIQGGMTVKIQDGSQNILALGATELGYFDGSTVVCSFKFQVNNVPKSNFYTISVGNRRGVNYSFDDMKNMGWKVTLSLG
ncbi:MAG: PASTA domain-containing protein [Pseudanabaena sp.]|jgi:hypothetical protein